MQPNQIIVIQTSCIGSTEARNQFDRFGIMRDVNYIFLRVFFGKQEIHIDSGLPQLVFTSHVDGHDSRTVASRIKAINSSAVVFALTTSEVPRFERGKLDGVISKSSSSPIGFVARLSKSFLNGESSAELIKAVQILNC